MRQQQVTFKAYSDAASAQQIVDALRVGSVSQQQVSKY